MTEPTNPGPLGTSGAGDPSFVPPLAPPTTYSMPDITDLVEGSKGRTPAPRSGSGLGRNVVIGGIVGAVVIAGGAFFAGRAVAAGPATLADAVAQAGAGTLPCGTPSGDGAGGGQFLSRLCDSAAGAGAPLPGGGASGAPGGGAGGFGGRGLSGTVSTVTATTITVTTRAGDVTVAVPSGVTVAKTVDGTLADVTVGKTVTIVSTTDATGNRTATRVTVVPADALPDGPGPAPSAS